MRKVEIREEREREETLPAERRVRVRRLGGRDQETPRSQATVTAPALAAPVSGRREGESVDRTERADWSTAFGSHVAQCSGSGSGAKN